MTGDTGWRPDRPVGQPDVPADVDAELAFHRQALIEDLIRSGMSPEEAAREAVRRLAALAGVRRELVAIDTRRDRRWSRWERLGEIASDVRFAFRTLRKHRLFATMAVVSLGLGIGATTTILSAAHSILVRSLPYPDADRLVVIYEAVPEKGWHGSNISYQDYRSWREQSRTFGDIGIWNWSTLALSGEGEPERIEAAAVSPNLFPLLGRSPMIGRGFLAEEAAPNGRRVILLSNGLWRRRYAADPKIVGRSIMVDGEPRVVVGVMPPDFAFPDRGQAWIPFVPDPWAAVRDNRGYPSAIGRLAAGATLEQAKADLQTISVRLQREFSRENYGWVAEPMSLREDLVGDLRRPLQIFLVAAGFVLLIVCANVANLMLARGADRQRELAVRISIGAGRRRLVRQLLTESLVLALLGGILGGALAAGGLALFRLAFPNDVPFYIRLGVDGTALGVTALVSIITGVLFGTGPAFRSTAVDLTLALKDGTRSGDGVERSRLRRSLVVAEFALSFALLVGAGLLLESYRRLTGTDLGFQQHGILSARISLPEAAYPEQARMASFYRDLLERLRGIPGVESVGSAQGIPFSGWDVQSDLAIEGRPAPRQGEELTVHYQLITPGYFPTIGVPIVKGRGLLESDRDSVAPVAVVNEALARKLAPGDPIGRRVRLGGDERQRWITVVGVARDFRHYRLPLPMGPAMYFPYAIDPRPTQTLVLRTKTDPQALVGPMRAVIASLDPNLPAYQIQTFDQVVSRSLWRQRLQGRTVGIFAALALLLASVGIYGVISYSVAQRTRELGVRMALGASRRDVRGLILRQGLALMALGTVGGLALAIGATRLVRGLLYGVEPTDPVVFGSVLAILAGSGLVASYFPARRAAEVDPLVAMRGE